MNEEDFECHFKEYLHDIFGWSEEEVERQYQVYFGHEKVILGGKRNDKRADVVVLTNGQPSLVMELKWKVPLETGDSREQLFSYMKQLETEYGILTNGVSFQLFYKPLGLKGVPTKIFSSHYYENDKVGIRLGELLERDKFDESKLKSFCDSLLADYYKNKDSLKPFKPGIPNPVMEEQMTTLLDNKMDKLITIYKQWLDNSDNDYIVGQNEAVKWVRKNFFNNPDLEKIGMLTYRSLIKEIPKHLTNLKEGACRTLYKHSLTGDSRKRFIKCIKYINSVPEEKRFEIVRILTTNENLRIKGVGQSFWSEMVRCKFPDEIPLVNSKTINFFSILGLYVGVSAEEQHKNVYYCYKRWGSFYEGDISMLELSHMEHYALTDLEGKKFLNDNFGYSLNETV